MKINGINEETCIKCASCVEDCPSHLFHSLPTKIGDKKKVIFEDPYGECIVCGHCIAVCPTEAILFEGAEEPKEFEGVKDPSSIVSYDSMIKVLRSNRSIRQYKSDSVPKKEIQAVLDAIRYAPSARNARSWKYLILTDKDKIDDLKNRTIKLLSLLRKMLKIGKYIKFLLPKDLKEQVKDPATKQGLDKLLDKSEQGEDLIFYNAPMVVILYAPSDLSDFLSGNDAGIAFTYGMMAAQARGLGTCWIGFAQAALNRSKKNKKAFDIPKDMNITGVMTLGYPDVKYHRLPPRNPLNVRWN
ncbi:MAG: 4Fe-4S dicluster domain-containing protein [Candidatus Lokiarchaeota archaeon]|nr:4Fe-4S dicluster domain-containing protein [Candidatus Lokiarchaeota archaeon]